MRIEWECNGEKGAFPCCDEAFCVGLHFSFNGHSVSIMDALEDLEPRKTAFLGFECKTAEQTLPNGAVLHMCILSSDSPTMREITRKYAGEVYAEVTINGAQITVVNDTQSKQV